MQENIRDLERMEIEDYRTVALKIMFWSKCCCLLNIFIISNDPPSKKIKF